MAFSEYLCKLMGERGLTSYKLSKEIGVHISTITNWKNGAVPKVEYLKLLSEYFSVPMDDLYPTQRTADTDQESA